MPANMQSKQFMIKFWTGVAYIPTVHHRNVFELYSNYTLMGTDQNKKQLVTVIVFYKASMNVFDHIIQMSIN